MVWAQPAGLFLCLDQIFCYRQLVNIIESVHKNVEFGRLAQLAYFAKFSLSSNLIDTRYLI